MKKTLLFALSLLISSVLFLSSCTDDDEPLNQPPTISFVAGANFISSNATVKVNQPFIVKILAEANTASGSKIQSLKISRVFNMQAWDTTFAYNDATFTLEVTFTANSQVGVERITFEITDKAGQKASKFLDITTEPDITPIEYFSMKILGSYQNPTGSSFASINGNVYTMAQAFANQAIIDFLYWWGASALATIGAPDDENANLVYTGVNGLPNWAIKNATRFKTTTVTATEFDALDDGASIIDAATGSDQTRIGSLAVGNVIAFKTVTGKHGLIKVVNINDGAAGDITIDVKVEL
ncbi:MAG: hypothetical protein K0B08_00335 [Bacteroidales bacterium]|nr:hypothetical protein [Bacteroidales bacterium]